MGGFPEGTTSKDASRMWPVKFKERKIEPNNNDTIAVRLSNKRDEEYFLRHCVLSGSINLLGRTLDAVVETKSSTRLYLGKIESVTKGESYAILYFRDQHHGLQQLQIGSRLPENDVYKHGYSLTLKLRNT